MTNATAEHTAAVMRGMYDNDWLLNLPMRWTDDGIATIELGDLEYALGAPNKEWAQDVADTINGG